LTISDEITRSVSGNILSGIENGVAKSYTYDGAGRLTGATLGDNTFSYEYGAVDSSCSSLAGNNPNAGKSSNRTKLTYNGAETTYCYDYADRLIDSSDVKYGDVIYDDNGNTVSLGDSSLQTEFGYDSSGRSTNITETSSLGMKTIEYTRDTSDRVIERHSRQDVETTSHEFYGFKDSGSSPDFIKDSNGYITQKFITLPGAVKVTIKPQSQSASAITYSLTNIHSDTMATVNADGMLISKHMTGPFGEELLVQPTSYNTNPTNATNDTTYDYAGLHQKQKESSLAIAPVQMGARVYIPGLGRFLQVDSVEGGTLNSYVYAHDPVNGSDYSGKCFIFCPFVVQVVVAVFVAVTIAVASENLQRNPDSPAAWINMGLATAGAGSVSAGVGAGTTSVNPTTTAFRSSKPIIRSSASSGSIPKQSAQAWSRIKSNNYQSLGKGWKVAPYKNSPTTSGAPTLPSNTTYTEFYLSPKPNPGPERIVMGSNGDVYYTADHYNSFIKLE